MNGAGAHDELEEPLLGHLAGGDQAPGQQEENHDNHLAVAVAAHDADAGMHVEAPPLLGHLAGGVPAPGHLAVAAPPAAPLLGPLAGGHQAPGQQEENHDNQLAVAVAHDNVAAHDDADAQMHVEAPPLAPPQHDHHLVAHNGEDADGGYQAPVLLKSVLLTVLTLALLTLIGLLSVGSVNAEDWVKAVLGMGLEDWRSTLFALAGDVTTLLLIYSPIDTFVVVWRARSVGDRSHLSNVAAVVNCAVWVWYGFELPRINYSVVVTNGTGAVFHVAYILVFFKCCENYWFFFKVLAAGVVAGIGITGIVLYLFLAGSYELAIIIGMSGMITGSFMYGLAAFDNVVAAHRSNGEQGGDGLVPTFVNATLWSLYATVINDSLMLVPNAIGLVCCFFRLSQRLLYRYFVTAEQVQAWVMGALGALFRRGNNNNNNNGDNMIQQVAPNNDIDV